MICAPNCEIEGGAYNLLIPNLHLITSVHTISPLFIETIIQPLNLTESTRILPLQKEEKVNKIHRKNGIFCQTIARAVILFLRLKIPLKVFQVVKSYFSRFYCSKMK